MAIIQKECVVSMAGKPVRGSEKGDRQLSKYGIIDFLRARTNENSDATPKYARLSSAIKIAIAENSLPQGAFIPSERVLAKGLGYSRITVRKAIDELVKTGILIRRHGTKTTVAYRFEKKISNLAGFSEDLRLRGMEPGAQVISAEITIPADVERDALSLNNGELVVKLQRIRLADNKPIAIEIAVIPQRILNSPNLVGESLYTTLEQLGALPVRGIQKISAALMNASEAKLLNANVGAPMLIIERCCLTSGGEPVELTTTRYKAGVYDFVTDLQR